MALGSRLWRPVPVDCWEWLEDLSPLAQRTWFWLWTGPTSTPHGVVSVRPYHAAGALKTKPSALLVALSELEQAGRIVMQQGSPSRVDLYLVGYLPAQCSVRPVQRRGIKKGIERVDLGLPTTQALEEWAIWDSACRKAAASLESGWSEPEPQQKQKQKQENKQEKMVSTGTPAVAVDTKPKRANARPTLDETGVGGVRPFGPLLTRLDRATAGMVAHDRRAQPAHAALSALTFASKDCFALSQCSLASDSHSAALTIARSTSGVPVTGIRIVPRPCAPASVARLLSAYCLCPCVCNSGFCRLRFCLRCGKGQAQRRTRQSA